MTNKVLIYITAPNKIVAKKIGTALLQDRLIACANILPGMESIYMWQDKVNYANEAILILKTTFDHVAEIKERLPALHNYECPCLLVLPVSDGYEAYLDWIDQAVSE